MTALAKAPTAWHERNARIQHGHSLQVEARCRNQNVYTVCKQPRTAQRKKHVPRLLNQECCKGVPAGLARCRLPLAARYWDVGARAGCRPLLGLPLSGI